MPDLPIGIEELRYQVTDRDGYWWMECGACDADWQVPHYAEESLVTTNPPPPSRRCDPC